MARLFRALSLMLSLSVLPAHAADLPQRDLDRDARDGAGSRLTSGFGDEGRSCTLADITPQYGPIVPTNSLCDPTYVGSAAGLSRPSYDGTLQPPAFRAYPQP